MEIEEGIMILHNQRGTDYILLELAPLIVCLNLGEHEYWSSYVVIPTPERVKHVAILSDN